MGESHYLLNLTSTVAFGRGHSLLEIGIELYKRKKGEAFQLCICKHNFCNIAIILGPLSIMENQMRSGLEFKFRSFCIFSNLNIRSDAKGYQIYHRLPFQ